MLAVQIAALVRERRMLRQLTQAEVARLADVSRAVVARLERPGVASVRMEQADRVLRVLGVRVYVAVLHACATSAGPPHGMPLH